MEIVFRSQTLNDIFKCDEGGTVTSHSEINVFSSQSELTIFLLLVNLGTSRTSM